MTATRPSLPLALPLTVLVACAFGGCRATPACPIPWAQEVDHWILPGETHFARLWQVTQGGENAEAYWSHDGTRLCLQARSAGAACDQIFVTGPQGLERISDGRGVTTCSYFLPGDREVLFASTGASHADCPPPPDRSRGYVWALHPEYDIYAHDLASGATRPLIGGWGYDAEATLSPLGDRIVFTSTRSGDIELWTCDLSGGDLRQVTHAPGYDGGAFFSHDGRRLVFRSTAFTPGAEEEELADYRSLLAQDLVRPSRMEIMVADADGGHRRAVTALGKANFAPYFHPSDRRILFASNHHDERARATNFDIFAVDDDGGNLERITFYDAGDGKQFDGFPMFSPDGRYLAFSSNRGDGPAYETNVFVALWRD